MLIESDYYRRAFKKAIIKEKSGVSLQLKGKNTKIFQNILRQDQKIRLVNKMLNADKPYIMNKYFKALKILNKSNT